MVISFRNVFIKLAIGIFLKYGHADTLNYTIKLQNEDFQTVSLENYHNRNVLFFYFDPLCHTCTDLNKKLVEVKIKLKGVSIIGIVSGDKSRMDFFNAVNSSNFEYHLLWDAPDLLFQKALKLEWTPSLILVGKDGYIKYKEQKPENLDNLLKIISN